MRHCKDCQDCHGSAFAKIHELACEMTEWTENSRIVIWTHMSLHFSVHLDLKSCYKSFLSFCHKSLCVKFSKCYIELGSRQDSNLGLLSWAQLSYHWTTTTSSFIAF